MEVIMTKILLVEDDKSLREIYGVRLMAEGYEIVSAGDGEEALALAIKERPGLIVSDVMMPKISGFDMLDILRSTSETKDIKVIMMTALSSDDQRARGESLGADRYLVKSQVGIEDVVRTVHEVLGDGVAVPTPAPSFPPVAPAPTPTPTTPPQPAEPVSPVSPSSQPTPAPVTPAPIVTQPQVVPTPQASPAPVPAPTQPAQPAQPTQAPVTNLQPPVQPQPVTPVPPQPPVERSMPSLPATPVMPVTPVTPTPITPPQAPVQPTQAPQPAASVLPQPTAPFSTDRPTSLGDRFIKPLPSADNLAANSSPIAAQLDQELNGTDAAASTQQPPQPPAPTVQ